MKKRCGILCSLFLCLCVCVGCNQEAGLLKEKISKDDNLRKEETSTLGNNKNDNQNKNDNNNDKDKENNNENENDNKNEENIVEIAEQEDIQIDIDGINRMLEELNTEEKFLAIIPLSDTMVLLQCKNREKEQENFYVLSMKEGTENLHQIELQLIGEVECCTYEDCFALYDTANHVILLDYQFHVLHEILLPESIHPLRLYTGKRNYCVLPEKQKIFYYITQLENGELYVGLYETDYACAESRLVFKLEGLEKNLNFINGFFDICPGYSQKGLFFTGDYFEAVNAQSKECVGYLALDADMPVVCKTDMLQMELTESGALFYDGYRKSEGEYSGELLLIDESGNVSKVKTEYFKESERVSCDRQGRMLTCYEKETGEAVFNLYKEEVWQKQVVIPYRVEDFFLLNQGQCIMYSYRSQDGLRVLLQKI